MLWSALNELRIESSVNVVLSLPVPLKKRISYLTEQPTAFKDIITSIKNRFFFTEKLLV